MNPSEIPTLVEIAATMQADLDDPALFDRCPWCWPDDPEREIPEAPFHFDDQCALMELLDLISSCPSCGSVTPDVYPEGDCGDRFHAPADAPELEPKKCGKKLGERPDWMSPDQYDPCRCDLPEGHPPTDDESGHSCGHIRGEKP